MSDDFYDEEEEEVGTPPTPKAIKIIGRVIKYSFTAFMVLFFAFLLWRIFFSENEPSSVKTIVVSDNLSSAYADALAALKEGEELSGFAVYQTDDPLIGTCEDWHPEDDGVNFFAQFFIPDAVFFPTASEAQFVLRYNNSALTHLAEDYSIEGSLDKNKDWFAFTLVVVYEEAVGAGGLAVEKELRLSPSSALSDSTALYNYRQLTFEGIPDIESVKDMYLDIHYIEDVDYAATPYCRIRAYNGTMSLRDYELDRKDIAALTK